MKGSVRPINRDGQQQISMEDPTLAAADAAMEKREAERLPRGYVGMSGIGDCPRKTAYRHSLVGADPFNAQTLKNFADGHRTEELIIQRLRLSGATVIDRDPETGRQIEVLDHDGHFAGHLDGEIFGLLQAPKAEHVLEIKCVSDKRFAAFQRLKEKVGEKETLAEWSDTYYAQHQLYMLYRGRKRGYMVIASAGGRQWDSCRTEFHRANAEWYVERARQIIYERNRLPDRISESSSFWQCRWCELSGVCHDGAAPARNCRSCVWAKPVADGAWHCQRHDEILPYSKQVEGCDDQRYRPALVGGDVMDVDDLKNRVTYRLADESVWVDRGEIKNESISIK